MQFQFSEVLGPVKLALMDTAEQAEKRRLRTVQDAPCAPGCAGCCHRLVKSTVAEAVLLYGHLKKSGRWGEVRRRARKALPMAKDAEPVSWFMMRIPCPVLDPETSRCLAYPVRPAACSTHFVRSDPEICNPHGVRSGAYVPVDFNDLTEKFLRRLVSSVAGYGILQLQLPLQSGLLLAEAVNLQSGLSLERAVSMFFNEL